MKQAKTHQKLKNPQLNTIKLLDSLTDSFIALDPDWKIIFINKKAEQLMGKERELLIGKNAYQEFPHLKETQLYKQSLKAIQNNQVIRYEEYFPTLNSWLEISIHPSDQGLSIYGNDITDKRAVENELKLRLQQQHFVALLGQKALIGLDLLDLMNEATKELTKILNVEYSGILKIDSVDKSLLLIAGDGWKNGSIDKATVGMEKNSHAGYTLLANKPVIVSDVLTEKRFKTSNLVRSHNARSGISVVINGVEDKPFGILEVYSIEKKVFTQYDINFLESISHVISSAIARRTHERRKDEFLSIASHELRTPMTSIKAFSQILEKYFQNSGDSKAMSLVSKMNDQIDRLIELIENLLDISRIESGKMRFNEERFNLSDLIHSIIEEIQPISNAHTIHYETEEKNIMIYADKYRIGQVFTNLLTNAIKYSPQSNKIVVRTSLKADSVEVAVQDFGIGIPEPQQNRIFERFYRAEGSNRESYPGLGLGLHISREIIIRHKGTIWLESKEGLGSTFYFTLPLDS
jgi:PAS domain S-box-containing protein